MSEGRGKSILSAWGLACVCAAFVLSAPTAYAQSAPAASLPINPPAQIVSQRARVRVSAGNVVTDFGTVIRGTSYLPRYPDVDRELAIVGRDVLRQKWRSFKTEYGLNAIQIDFRTWSVGSVDPASFTALIDLFVDWSAEDGVYLILGYGNKPGTIDAAGLKRFWEVFAPRYKDHTHVIYELNNEPAELALPKWPQATLALQGKMYGYIRGVAPDTYVILFSVPNITGGAKAVDAIRSVRDVDYGNASVGFHWYGGDAQTIEALRRSGYPVICTEFKSQSELGAIDYVSLVDRVHKLEAVHAGWIPHQPRIENLGKDFKVAIEAAGISWEPDFGSWPLSNIQSASARRNTP